MSGNGSRRVGHLFDSLLVVFLRELVAPVQEGLSHDGADLGVVELCAGLVNLGDEIIFPPAVDAGAVPPAAHLAGVVVRATALQKRTR